MKHISKTKQHHYSALGYDKIEILDLVLEIQILSFCSSFGDSEGQNTFC